MKLNDIGRSLFYFILFYIFIFFSFSLGEIQLNEIDREYIILKSYNFIIFSLHL